MKKNKDKRKTQERKKEYKRTSKLPKEEEDDRNKNKKHHLETVVGEKHRPSQPSSGSIQNGKNSRDNENSHTLVFTKRFDITTTQLMTLHNGATIDTGRVILTDG